MSDVLLDGRVLTHEAMARALQVVYPDPEDYKKAVYGSKGWPEFDEARNLPHDMALQIREWLRVRGVQCEVRCGPVEPPVKFHSVESHA